jgi:hypothetical protein
MRKIRALLATVAVAGALVAGPLAAAPAHACTGVACNTICDVWNAIYQKHPQIGSCPLR